MDTNMSIIKLYLVFVNTLNALILLFVHYSELMIDSLPFHFVCQN